MRRASMTVAALLSVAGCGEPTAMTAPDLRAPAPVDGGAPDLLCGAAADCPRPGPGADVSCERGACVASCRPAFFDCEGKPATGCADVMTDVRHCGACGHACPPVANGAPACRAGACRLGSCSLGWLDCNGKPDDGCEAQTVSDKNNCGACGRACAGAHSTQACRMGACAVEGCEPGWADCDGKADTGCESSPDSDPKHCGRCGNACPVNLPMCIKGACSNAARVALVYADGTPNLGPTLAAALNPGGEFLAIDLVDAAAATPALPTLARYRALLVWDNAKFADRVALGNVLADYVDGGGGVVLAQYAFWNGMAGAYDLGGRWAAGNGGVGYNCIAPGAQAPAVLAQKANDPMSPLVAGVAQLTTQNAAQAGLVNGATSVWSYVGGDPAIATCSPGGKRRVDLNFWPNPASWTGDGYVMMRNALLYAAN